MSAHDYEGLTGDRSRSSVSVWLADGADPAKVVAQMQNLGPEMAHLKWISANDIRQLSLKISTEVLR